MRDKWFPRKVCSMKVTGRSTSIEPSSARKPGAAGFDAQPLKPCCNRSAVQVSEEGNKRLRADHRVGSRAPTVERSSRHERASNHSRHVRSRRSPRRSRSPRERFLYQIWEIGRPHRAGPARTDRYQRVVMPKQTGKNRSCSFLASPSNSKSRRRGNPDTGRSAGDSQRRVFPCGPQTTNSPGPVPSRQRRKRSPMSPSKKKCDERNGSGDVEAGAGRESSLAGRSGHVD
jgi:hypothetical protein